MTYIKILLSVITIVLFTACIHTKNSPQTSLVPKKSIHKKEKFVPEKETKKTTKVTELNTDSSTITPDISGTYNLVEGAYIYNNGTLALQSTIEASSIVIEKLDEHNFGYYYVTKIEGLKTEGYFGGFTYKEGQFYQKVIDYPTTNTTLRDNINLSSKGDSLKLTVKTINAKRVIHWKKNKKSNPSITKALENEKKDYIELFKEKLFPVQHFSIK